MGKTQTTAKTLLEALEWIQSNPHHLAKIEFKGDTDERIAFQYAGYHKILRVKTNMPWFHDFMNMTTSNLRPHDDRLYTTTAYGRGYILKNNPGFDFNNHP